MVLVNLLVIEVRVVWWGLWVLWLVAVREESGAIGSVIIRGVVAEADGFGSAVAADTAVLVRLLCGAKVCGERGVVGGG